MLQRITGWSIRHPWKVVGLWLLLIAAVIVGGSSVNAVKATDADFRFGESGHASSMLATAGQVDKHSEMVHITASDGGRPDAASAKSAAAQVISQWRGDPTVASVEPAVTSPKDGTVLVRAHLKEPTDKEVDTKGLTDDVAQVASTHSDLRLGQFGTASTNKAINDLVADDLARSEKTALPVTLLIMIAVFGSLIAAGLPVLVALISVLIAGGMSGVLSHIFPQEPSVMSMIILIGMAVGVDYCLFYLKREREERAKGTGAVDAVKIAAATSGHAIVTSGVAVMVSLTGLFIMDFAPFNSLALGSLSVVFVAVLASLTLLPALLAKLGRWTDRLRIPGLGGHLAKVEKARRKGRPLPVERPSRMAGLVGLVVRRPAAALLLGVAVVAALAVPAMQLRTMPGGVDSLPPNNSTVKTYNGIRSAFPSEGTMTEVVTRLPGGSQETAREQLAAVTSKAAGEGWTAAGPVEVAGGIARVKLATDTPYGSEAMKKDVADLRVITDATLTADHGVTGDAASSVDMTDHLDARMPWAILTVLGLTSLMMAFAFRSVLIGLLTTVLNLASVAAAFGALSLAFQTDVGTSLLGVTNTGAVRDWVPMFLFCVLVGLSMDYHVFVLSRIRENVRAGMPTRAAITAGLGRTASVVTSAALVMVAVFSIFATLNLAEMKQIGLGLAIAIAVDATLVRLILLPSILSLLGMRAWGRAGRKVRSSAQRPELVGV